MTRPIRTPEVAELRAFCAAIDLGSIGRAARFLQVSQPALSKRIRGLETIAGTELLSRSAGGVTPTVAGRAVYEEARKALAQIEVVENLMAGLDRVDRPIRIAASHTIAEHVLPERMASFEGKSGHAAVELVIANSSTVTDLARRGHADIAIAALPPGEPPPDDAIAYFDGEVAVAVPKAHKWAACKEVPLDEFLETALIMRDPRANTRRVVEATLEERGLELPPPLLEFGSTAAVKGAAARQGVPALLAKLAVDPNSDELAAKRVAGLRFVRRFVILVPAGESLSAQGKAFLEHLLDGAQALRDLFE